MPPQEYSNSDNNWAKTDIEEALTFANQMSKVFSPNPINPADDILQSLSKFCNSKYRFEQ